MTGAEVVVARLEAAGVEVCFGLPGVHNLALWEALRRSPIRLVGVRHEQAAAYAADGYARATGRLGVALVTTGPGAANTLAAVGEAFASRSAVLVIATDIPTTLRRPGVWRGVLHETTDQAAMFAPVTRATHVCGEVGATVADAVDDALTLDGPVYLGVPTDLLGAPAEPSGRDMTERSIKLNRLTLCAADRPLLWVGAGARDRRAEVVALAEALAAPVIETFGGRGVMPLGHPCRVGFPPHVEPVGRLWDEADLVVAIGDPLDGIATQNFAQPQPPRLVTAGVPTPNYTVDRAVSDVDNLATDRTQRDLAPVAERLRRVRAEACAGLDARALRFLDAFAHAVPADAVVACDMCIPGYWIAGFHPFAQPRRLQYPMGWGTLGFAFPASLGAAVAGAGPVISVSGDGGFLYAPGELATVAQEAIGLTAVIVDDGGYGMLRYDQDVAGTARHGVDLRTPDFEALAGAFGIRSETVEGLEDDFGEALARHVADPEPSLLVARAEALVPPPTSSPNWYRRRRG